jgi:hypothetical protein
VRARAAVVAVPLAGTLLLVPAVFSLQTAATAHTGALPSAGPATTAFGSGGGRPRPGGFGGGFRRPGGQAPTRAGSTPAGFKRGGFGPGGVGQRGFGGLGGATTISSALSAALRQGAYRWAAATTGDDEAASLELASGRAVMALGGYNGTDPAISLPALKRLVASGEVHYYVADPQGFIGSTAAATSSAYAIEQWVEARFTARTVGGTTVYDLTAAR